MEQFTFQKILYVHLVITLSMLASLFFAPGQVSSLFRRKRVSLPIFTALLIVLSIYFQTRYQEYTLQYKDLPEDIKIDSHEYLLWQKDRLKLQRDGYLSLCCIISQIFLYSVSHWIDKYNRYVEFSERDKKQN